MWPSPTPRGALVISLDFELHWGVRDKLSVADYRQNLVGARRAVPAMLELFTEFGVHATWATVGFLFFESKRELVEALPARRPAYVHHELSPYEALDGVGENERDDPFHFAPSLIRRIADTPHQEVGTHTFSHYYCLEAGQVDADFRADLEAAVAVARAKLGRRPESIVFPRNQVAPPYLGVCREVGLVAYRGNLAGWTYRARSEERESLFRRGVRLARLGWCALAVGTGKAVLDYVIPYVNDRVAFGEPVSHRQGVAFTVADMAIELEGMRLVTYRAAGRAEQGKPYAREVALARKLCADKGMFLGSAGVQMLGGHGYVKEHPVERWYRDLRAIGVAEGIVLV